MTHRTYKKFTCISLIIFILLGLFLVNVGEAKAIAWIPLLIYAGITGGSILAFLKLAPDVIESVLTQTIYLLGLIAAWFVGIMGNLFNSILQFTTKMLAQTIVYDGWTITRDIVNMFFILGLVVIAFATILRIETYGMKTLLPKFIIIALLINFSYLACGIIIDAANIPTKYFADLIVEKDKAEIGVGGFMVASLLEPNANNEGVSVEIVPDDPYALLLHRLVETLINFLAGFALLIGAILLVTRMGALWVLIILAPFAWFFSIFPKLQQHASKWWDTFLKWAFFAPIYIFFIYLSIRLINTLKIESVKPGGMSDEFGFGIIALTQFVIALILLLGAPMVATSMGGKAATSTMTFAKGALKGTAKLPLKLQKATATMIPPAWMEKKVPPLAKFVRGIQKTAAYTSPELWKKAWEARKAERQRKARRGYIVGKQQDLLNRVFSLFSEKTNFAEQAEQFEVAEKKKEVEAETKKVGPRLVAKLNEALKQRDVLTYKAVMELLQEQGDTNDAMISDLGLFDDLKFDDKYALDKLKGQNVNDKEDRRFSNLGFKHGVIQQMRQMNLSDEQIAPFLGKMQEIGLQSGYYGLYGMTTTDDKGNIAIRSDEEQIKVAAAKIKTQPARVRKLHGTAVGMQGVDAEGQYKFAGHDDVSDALMKTYTLADAGATQMQYVRPDAQTSLYQAHKQDALDILGPGAKDLGEKVRKAIEEGDVGRGTKKRKKKS